MPTNTAAQLGQQVYGDAAARTEAQKRALLTEVAQTGQAATQRGDAAKAQAEALRLSSAVPPGAQNAARVYDPQSTVQTARDHEQAAFDRALGLQETSIGGYMDAVGAALPIEQSRAQSQAAMIYQQQMEAEAARRAALEQQQLQLQMAREAQAAARDQGSLARERFELEKEEVLRNRAQQEAAQKLNNQLTMLRQHHTDLEGQGGAGVHWAQKLQSEAQRQNVAQQIAALEAQQQGAFGPLDPMDQMRHDLMGLDLQQRQMEVDEATQAAMWGRALSGFDSRFGDNAQKLADYAEQIARGANPGSILGDLNREQKEAVLEAVNTFNQQLAQEQGISDPQQWTMEHHPGQSGIGALRERFPSGARKLASGLFGLGG